MKVLIKTRMSSTPIPMMTKREMRLRRPTVSIPRERGRWREGGGER